MHLIKQILEFIILILNLLSIIVLVWGVFNAGCDFIRSEMKEKDRITAARHNTFIKNYLGSYVLLSLEILIAADIIESIINPTLDDILKLAAVVIIRTVISYFLHQEITDAEENRE